MEARRPLIALALVALVAAPTHAFELVNRVRVAHDRPAVELGAKLTRRALQHTRVMVEAGYLFHSDLEGCGTCGEIVGVGSGLRPLMRAFLHSKPHRRILLSRTYTRVGIGVVRSDGSVWLTAVFKA